MLVLSRRVGDSILLDGGIRIVVVSCDRGSVRLGIEAPPEVGIVRGELAIAIAEENQRANAGEQARAWLTHIPAKRAKPESVGGDQADPGQG